MTARRFWCKLVAFQMGLFTSEQMAAMAGGIVAQPPANYKLPTEFPSLRRAKRISLDFESHDESITNGIGPGWRRGAYPVGIGVAIIGKDWRPEFSEYYPLRHRVGPNIEAAKFYEYLANELAFFDGEIIGANLLYEADGLSYQDVFAPFARWRDIQWAEALIDETSFSYKLDSLARKYLKQHKVTDELKMLYGDSYIERMRDCHPGHVRAYGLGDVELPALVLAEQNKILRKEKMDDLYDLECRLMPFLLYMRRLGVRVDLDKSTRFGETLTQKRDAALRDVTRLVGVRGFELTAENFEKPTTLAFVFDRLGIKYPLTATGKPSIKNVWLKRLDHPVGELLATANVCEKAKGTFIDGYIDKFAINGRVHCEFHPLRKVDDSTHKKNGAVSGRFSCVHPNLQNIPSRDDELDLEIGPECRGMFIADEGADWWSQDYSQIEYRFLVHYAVALECAGASLPQKAFIENPDADFHELCAKLIWKDKWNDVQRRLDIGEIVKDVAKKLWKAIRGPAKNLNFGMVYGMGKDKLAADLGETNPDGTPNENALRIMAEYHAAAPFIKDLNKKLMNRAQEKGYAETILGRRRRFNFWEPKFTERGAPRPKSLPYEQAVAAYGQKLKRSDTNIALNATLQGSAADLMKKAMVDMWEAGIFDAGNDITCVLTVHDELNGSVLPTARGKESLRAVKHIMETAMKLHLPVLTSGSTGRTWAEAK